MAQAPTITPKEIIGIFRRHLFLITLFTMMGLFMGGGGWFLLKKYFPKYTAEAFIMVLPPGKMDPMTITEPQPNKDRYFQFRNTKVAFMKQQNFRLKLLERDKIRETEWFQRFGADKAKAIVDAVDDFDDNLGVSAPRDGEWIRVAMTCGDKKEAALIVNEVVDLFVREQYDIATRDIRAQLAKRVIQQRKIKQDIDATEATLKTIRDGTEFVNLGGQGFRNYLTEKLTMLEQSLSGLETQMKRLESFIEIFRVRAEGEYDDVMREQMERDPIANSMRQRVASFELSLANLAMKFGENHRRLLETREILKQAKADLAKRQNEIADIQRKANLRNAEDQLQAFTQELEATRELKIQTQLKHREMDNVKAQYQKFEVLRDEKLELHQAMTENVEKLKALIEDPEVSKVKNAGRAPEPLKMSSPKPLVYIPGGFMLGLLAGIGLAFAIELLNDLLRTPSDVMKHLHVPLLGMICHEEDDDELEGIDLYHVVRQAPYSIMSECYRQFRTNLKLSGSSGTHKTLLITSVGAGDGKTSVAINMTATLVADDRTVLLIDTNFRKPSTATVFPRTMPDGSIAEHSDFGLSNYLMGQCGHEEVIRNCGIEGFDIIDSGPLPSNPAEILGNERMTQLLAVGRQLYDYVVIDGPPLLVSEAKALAVEVDGTILVFNTASTRRGMAKRALRELREVDANIVGTVLLGVKSMKGGYFDEVYRSYQQYQQVQVNQPI
jgi:capsular exopolysaccharide synthesis family protein